MDFGLGMNIECQCCGLVLSILLLVLYSGRKQLGLYGERIFKYMLIVTIALLSLDILSIVGIHHQDVWPRFLVMGLCKLYIASLVVECMLAVIYLFHDVMDEKLHWKVSKVLGAVALLECLAIFFVPLEIYCNGRIVYTYGVGAYVAYGSCAIDFIAILVTAFSENKKIPGLRWSAFMIWVFLWIVAAAWQFIDAEKLLVGFATSLGMMILYAALENPEVNLNSELGCFNGYALEAYLKQQFGLNRKFFAIQFSLDEIPPETEEYIYRLMHRSNARDGVWFFKLLGPEFMMISEDRKRYNRLIRWIQNEQKRESIYFKNIQGLGMENGLDVGSPAKLTKVFKYFFNKYNGQIPESEIEITKDKIKDYLEHESIQDEITQALAEDRVEVFFQPIYNACSKKFESAEALARIRRADGSLIYPSEFIPVAEDSGTIVALGERVFVKVCKFIASGRMQQAGVKYVEVNLSVLQCEQIDLANRLCSIMKRYHVPSNFINLEITETATLSVKKNLLNNMGSLMEMGCTFSLDDFGKGESNLMYIVEMPVSIVKMDYDLTKAFFQMDRAKHVVKTVVQMAHEMGLHVVSEGVESAEELAALSEIGVDYIQGYYFSKPVPEEEFLKFVEEKNS